MTIFNLRKLLHKHGEELARLAREVDTLERTISSQTAQLEQANERLTLAVELLKAQGIKVPW